MKAQQNNVIVLCGPTSTGKTTLGIDLAKTLNAVIISADSRQIYKYMDIGTGKVPVTADVSVLKDNDCWLLDGVKIYGYDLVSPDQPYSAHAFSTYARNLINSFINESTPIVVVGGTGFYVDVLTGRIQPSRSAPNLELRDELNANSLEKLQAKLQSLSLEEFERIDINNKIRLVRAIEKIVSTESQSVDLPLLNNVRFHLFGLRAPNSLMFEKVDKWAQLVWENGLIKETGNLLSKGYGDTAPVNGLIYKSVKAFLNEQLPQDQAIQRTKYDLHAYIRRQLTWFKRNGDIHWYDLSLLSPSQIKSDLLSRFSV